MTDRPNQAATTRRRCPICGQPAEAAYRPFCSKRCRDKDLGNWAAEAYAVPAEEDAVDDDPEA